MDETERTASNNRTWRIRLWRMMSTIVTLHPALAKAPPRATPIPPAPMTFTFCTRHEYLMAPKTQAVFESPASTLLIFAAVQPNLSESEKPGDLHGRRTPVHECSSK